MKILVPIKRVPDTDQRVRVADDMLHVETADMPFVVNPFDAIALEEAIRIREARSGDAEVVVIGVGGEEYEQELRTGLAMGADRACVVRCDTELDPWNVACILQQMVGRESPALVLMGKQAVDDDLGQTGPFLASLLQWPQATFASRIELQGEMLTVGRETDRGIETLTLPLPAVVTVDLRLNEPRYASLPSILKARQKQIEHVDVRELGVEIQPRLQVLKMESVFSQRRCQRVSNVDELLERLKAETKIL
ncbi:MAG: electron transfer flavoprotein subunit beta/FixA family protein [Pirellulaceae bacterium]|nr:electron transfer flavoprotein subunit beta/FixA family protein [Planctomycetales bacterium]